MLIILIAMILGFFICYNAAQWNEVGRGIAGCAIGLSVGFIICLSVGFLIPQEEVISESKIYTFSDLNNYICTNYSEGKTVIQYITETDTGKCIKTIDAGNVHIQDTADEAKIVEHSYVWKSKLYWLFAARTKESWYEFYIPEGSVAGGNAYDTN